MYEFNQDQSFRLLDVLDHEGNSKRDTHEMYQRIIGSIAKNIRREPYSWFSDPDKKVARMQFVQSNDGKWMNYNITTSPVLDIQDEDNRIQLYTENSLYIFEPAEIVPPEYLDEAEVIELYLTNDSHYKFCTGFYYDGDKKPSELVCHVHAGTLQDSCLITLKESPGVITCRYFPFRYSLEFYNTIYRQQDYSRRLFIHNVGKDTLTVSFERFKAEWRIAPGDKRWITPYDKTGADETYEDESF